jgi:hypothetical protein
MFEIIRLFRDELGIPADAQQIFCGDLKTCAVLRSSSGLRNNEAVGDENDSFGFINVMLGEFHYKMHALEVIKKVVLSNHSIKGTIAEYSSDYKNMKSYDAKKWNYYQMRYLLVEGMESMVTALLEGAFEGHSTPPLDFDSLVATVSTNITDSKYNLMPDRNFEQSETHTFKHYVYQCIQLIFMFFLLESSVEHGDGEGIVRMHHMLLVLFASSEKKNYASATVTSSLN